MTRRASALAILAAFAAPAAKVESVGALTDAGAARDVARVPRGPGHEADIPPLLAAAAESLPAGLRETLARKPAPWIVKAHDVGAPTDFNADTPWHLLDKEKDPRFPLPNAGKLGVVNTNTDVNILLGLAAGDAPIRFDPPRRYTDHLVNLAAQEVQLPGVRAQVLFLPIAGDTLLIVVTARNTSDASATIRATAVCAKEPDGPEPFDRYGYGIHVTTGRLAWAAHNPANDAQVCCFEEWARDRRPPQVVGSLLCSIVGSEPAISTGEHTDALPIGTHAALAFRLDLPPGRARTLRVAVNLHRFGPKRFETKQQIVLYPQQTPEAACEYSIRAAVDGLAADWPALVRASYTWYERMPVFRLPQSSWAADLACALELPRGNTWSAQDVLRQPWYTFCRVHGHNPYGWWSYGMHAHEHLSTFVTNLTEPTLSQSYLRGHFQVQEPDGFIQYGVNHRGENCNHDRIATCPLLMTEAWTAYLWSGDRAFLAQAYEVGGRYIRWWRSPARTRGRVPLQHWHDYIETVRDDRDLATWAATDGAERQEALDLNCYLLGEEQSLAAIARELGRTDEAGIWAADAQRRTALMREHLWHAEDRVYYGRDTAGVRWARVMDISTFLPLWCGLATPEQAERIASLLHDPQTFGTAFPVATLAVRHMPERQRGVWHWRGSNWVEMTWLVIQGLRRYGCYTEAARLAEINCRMVFDTLERTGHFREFYNSLTGEPSDLTDYIWTSMPAIMAVEVFFGIRPTAEGIEILPALPTGWDDITIENLRCRRTRLSVRVRRDANATSATATVNGQPRETHNGRGILLRWAEAPSTCRIEIVQPATLQDRTLP